MAVSYKNTEASRQADAQAIGDNLRGLPILSNDTQISGVQDDGSPEGIIRAKIENGELFRYFASDFTYPEVSISYGTDSIAPNKGRGWDSLILSQVAAGATQSVSFSTVVYGSTIGLRFSDLLSGYVETEFPDATIVVDAVAYRLWDAVRIKDSAGAPKEAIYFIPEILSKDWHRVQVILHPKPSTAQVYKFFGFVLERLPTRIPFIRNSDSFVTKGVLTTDPVAIPFRLPHIPTSTSATINAFNIKRIIYHNNSGSAKRVKVLYGGQVVFSRSIAPDDTEVFNISESGVAFVDGADLAYFTHQCDANASVNFVTVGNVI